MYLPYLDPTYLLYPIALALPAACLLAGWLAVSAQVQVQAASAGADAQVLLPICWAVARVVVAGAGSAGCKCKCWCKCKFTPVGMFYLPFSPGPVIGKSVSHLAASGVGCPSLFPSPSPALT